MTNQVNVTESTLSVIKEIRDRNIPNHLRYKRNTNTRTFLGSFQKIPILIFDQHMYVRGCHGNQDTVRISRSFKFQRRRPLNLCIDN